MLITRQKLPVLEGVEVSAQLKVTTATKSHPVELLIR